MDTDPRVLEAVAGQSLKGFSLMQASGVQLAHRDQALEDPETDRVEGADFREILLAARAPEASHEPKLGVLVEHDGQNALRVAAQADQAPQPRHQHRCLA